MFASSIFYDRQSLRDCEYSLNEIHSFTCKSGKWKCRKYFGNRGRNGHLGDLVKAIDSLMREKKDFKHKISYTGVSKTAVKLIQAEIDALYEEQIITAPSEPVISEAVSEVNDESPLDSDEKLFIKALLYGRDTNAAAKSCGKMVSILADSINEKLFDLFGDTVIDFSADSPELIEDYTDELREMFPDNKE